MEKEKIKVAVLGAGISGLSTAYWLIKEGYDVTVYESNRFPGGAMITETDDDYLIDYGPNSGLETTPLISKLVDEIGLKDQMIYANENASIRYILKNNSLHPLPTSAAAFLKTKLFSVKAKLRLMKEPFVGKSGDGYFQSIAEFVERRLGREFLDYAIDPFVSGVFAGDPAKLSVASAFPKLYRLEEIYGGLIKGMILGARERKKRNEESKQSAKMFTFYNGMQSFPQAITDKIKDNVRLKCIIEKIEKNDKGFKIYYSEQDFKFEATADIILSTMPAYKASEIYPAMDETIVKTLNNIFYPPVMVLYLGYKKENIGQPLDGFGFLIPSKEKKSFLGAIWSSTIFPNRAAKDKASFTLFIGGSRSPNLFNKNNDDLIKNVISEFSDIMKIKGEPELLKTKLWERAIPQYNLGYIQTESAIKKFEKENKGFFLGGNYLGGISVGDCVKNSEINLDRINSFVKNEYQK
ncbi:MAG: protoporphyrinogen oxidase [Bacteroidetes bacterium]|nr:protoporphyrinogen oxidase [Bacteroidota bacterium]